MWSTVEWLRRRFFSVPNSLINVAAVARDEWVKAKAETLAPSTLVLDAGAGRCQYRDLFRHCNYRTQDFVSYEGTPLGPAAESWPYGHIDYVSDISAIPVADESFDVILCTEVLEHIPDPVAALREFGRILKPGGRLLLTAPLGSGLHQEPYHYYGGFTPHFYRKYLPIAGISPVEIRPIGGLLRFAGQTTFRVGALLGQNSRRLRLMPLRFLLMYWLPKVLAKLEDSGVLYEQFTVGYLVEGQKL